MEKGKRRETETEGKGQRLMMINRKKKIYIGR
jgi:hypothetical protein